MRERANERTNERVCVLLSNVLFYLNAAHSCCFVVFLRVKNGNGRHIEANAGSKKENQPPFARPLHIQQPKAANDESTADNNKDRFAILGWVFVARTNDSPAIVFSKYPSFFRLYICLLFPVLFLSMPPSLPSTLPSVLALFRCVRACVCARVCLSLVR